MSSAHRRKLDSNIGKLIAMQRKKKGFPSSKSFAEASDGGIDWTTLAQIEAGNDFRMSTFLRLCRLLKIKPADLLKMLK